MSHNVANRKKKPTLSVAQETVLAELLIGATVTKAAETAGVDRRTVHRWLSQDELFYRTHESLREARWAEIQTEIGALVPDALRCLADELRDKKVPAHVRHKAVASVLSNARPVAGWW